MRLSRSASFQATAETSPEVSPAKALQEAGALPRKQRTHSVGMAGMAADEATAEAWAVLSARVNHVEKLLERVERSPRDVLDPETTRRIVAIFADLEAMKSEGTRLALKVRRRLVLWGRS